MPVVRIEYDNIKVTEEDATKLSKAIHEIVSTVTAIKDVPVYSNTSQIKVEVAPIEIFIEMSDYKIKNADDLMANIKKALSAWKNDQDYNYPINMTLIPMNWKVEVDI